MAVGDFLLCVFQSYLFLIYLDLMAQNISMYKENYVVIVSNKELLSNSYVGLKSSTMQEVQDKKEEERRASKKEDDIKAIQCLNCIIVCSQDTYQELQFRKHLPSHTCQKRKYTFSTCQSGFEIQKFMSINKQRLLLCFLFIKLTQTILFNLFWNNMKHEI